MQKLGIYLWFNNNGEEAVNYYKGIFPDMKVEDPIYYSKEFAEMAGNEEGSIMMITFHLFGQRFVALNGGPQFQFTEATSFEIVCEDQEEVDHYWNALTADGGEESMCGWLKDKFGVSWQITPKRYFELMESDDPEVVQNAMSAILQMQKIEVEKLEKPN